MRNIIALAFIALAGCAAVPGAQPTAVGMEWRTAATPDDRARLRDWRTSFTRALEKARKAGHSGEIAAEGALLAPDAALGPVPIPNGDYRCRVIKVGSKSDGLLDYIAYPAFACRIDQRGSLQGFTKLTGSQRHVGLIYPADALRQVFLGTLVLGDETGARKYGSDAERDLAGWVERIGDRRWRVILPYPHYESIIDVIELVPAG